MVEPSPEKAVVWALVLLVDVVRFLLEAVLFLLEVLPPEEVELFLLEELPPEEVELFLLEELPLEEELFRLELLWLFVWEELEFFFEELLFVLLPQEAGDRASAPAMQTARPRVK